MKNLTTGLRNGLRQSIAGGLGAGDIFSTASLDLNFAKYKNLGQRVDATTGSNLVDFTRASSGTYVGSDGLIKTATTNLFLRSEEFDNASWTKSRTSAAANVIASPNGTITADKVVANTDNNTHILRQTFTSVSAEYTVSFYVKAGEYSSFTLLSARGDAAAFRSIGVNLATKSLSVLVTGMAGSQSLIDIGGGWFRVSLTFNNIVAGSLTYADIRLSSGTPAAFGESFMGDDVSGIYIWGAQLEQSSTVGEYVKTTSTINSAPRFDHNPTTGESLGLLVEESRTNLVLQSEDFATTWSNANDITVSANQITAPDGNLTGDLITADATNTVHNIFQDSTVGSGSYTFSCYIKANGYTTGALRTGLDGNFVNGDFDLTAKTISISTNGTAISGTGDIIDVGDGWFRCWISASNIGSGSSTRNVIYPKQTASYLGDGTSGIYIWGAQLEEGSFPTSYIPTEGSTVTRAADVASISGDNFGAFRTNLLEYSEEFDKTSWGKTGLQPFGSGSVVDATASPYGTISAEKIVEDASTGFHLISQVYSLTSGVTYTFSVYAKAGERHILQINAGTGFNLAATRYNLTDGTYANIAGSPVSSIIPVGNDWYRCTITATASTTTSSGSFPIYITNGSTSNYTGDGTSGIYIWGAQLEEGSTATNYIKSDVNFVSRASSATYYDANGVIQTAAVDEARTAAYLPDGNGNFVSAGPLLLEDAVTNLLLQSEDFSTTWTPNRGSVTTNVIAAPNGTLTADKFNETADVGVSYPYQTVTVNGVATFSVFVKAGERNYVCLYNSDAAVGRLFDIVNGTIGSTFIAAPIDSQITDAGGGWYRCSIAFTGTGAAGQCRIYTAQNDSTVTANVEGEGLYLWGAQLEAGSYPTSYIPTTSSTATRAADVSTSAAASVFESDWYRQDEGTVFADYRPAFAETSSNKTMALFAINDNSNDNAIQFFRRAISGNQSIFNVRISGSNVIFLDTGIWSTNQTKLSAAYKVNDFASVINAGTIQTDTTGAIPAVSQILIGNAIPDAYASSHIRRLTYWPTRLPNDTLQTITQ